MRLSVAVTAGTSPMDKQPPRLMQGGLSGRIYVVTKYRELGNDSVEALEKFDITDDFYNLCIQLGTLVPPV